jgi:uncharacterized membrane protein
MTTVGAPESATPSSGTQDDVTVRVPRVFSAQLSRPGLVVAALFFAASLAPSLLPRTGLFQGLVSGITLACGYGIGVLAAWTWRYLGLPAADRGTRVGRILLGTVAAVVISIVAVSVWRQVGWQNDVRELFGMESVGPSVWLPILPVTLLVAGLLLVVGRCLRRLVWWVGGWAARVLPPRLARVVAVLLVAILTSSLVSGVLVDGLFGAANQSFSLRDGSTIEGITRPTSALRSGGPDSLVAWDSLGRQGRRFVATGPTVRELNETNGGGAREPIRVYAGIKSADDLQQRADLVLAELRRTNAFDRSVLVVATTTGTGFLEPNAMNSLEYLHNGDTAVVGVQYSYLPSWISLLADQQVTKDTSDVVFDAIHDYWSSLPEDDRPELYLFGLSLGSFGVESILTSINVVNSPIDGALLTGPPFVNVLWQQLTDDRDPGSPASLPIYQDGRTVRFTAQEDALDRPIGRWGDTKVVYLQHGSDPVTFFSPDLAVRPPDWLQADQRAPDVSPRMDWVPLVTMWQVLFDLPAAGSVPTGFGHMYTSAECLSGWVGISRPAGWSDGDTERLRAVLAERERQVEE